MKLGFALVSGEDVEIAEKNPELKKAISLVELSEDDRTCLFAESCEKLQRALMH